MVQILFAALRQVIALLHLGPALDVRLARRSANPCACSPLKAAPDSLPLPSTLVWRDVRSTAPAP